MFRVSATFFTFCVLLFSVYAFPNIRSGVKQCYGEECPENTFACEKTSSVSRDRKNIEVEIHCLDLGDNVLKNVTKTQENHFGSSVMFQSYSYSGAYEVFKPAKEAGGTLDQGQKTTKKDVEDFDNSIDVSIPKTSRPQYSEIDDLNRVSVQ